MKYLILIISLFLCGCATPKYYPSGVYVAEYTESMMKYYGSNNATDLKEANKQWDMYLRARAHQVKLEK